MQVLQFKTVHLAVIGAIASAFGMAAGPLTQSHC